jgi:hypothetical protein
MLGLSRNRVLPPCAGFRPIFLLFLSCRSRVLTVRFGSQAVVRYSDSPPAAYGQKRTLDERLAGIKKPTRGRVFGFLVAGARFALFLQSRGECVSSDILSVGSAKRSDSRPIPGTSGLSHTMEFLILLRKACHSGSFDSCSGSILMACE